MLLGLYVNKGLYTKIKMYEDRVNTTFKVKKCLKKMLHISAYH